MTSLFRPGRLLSQFAPVALAASLTLTQTGYAITLQPGQSGVPENAAPFTGATDPRTLVGSKTSSVPNNAGWVISDSMYRTSAGTLDLQFSMVPSMPDGSGDIKQVSLTNVAGLSVDASYFPTTAGDSIPTTVTRSDDGNLVTFENFLNPSPLNQSFPTFVLRTNATTFEPDVLNNVIFNVADGNGSPPPIPEPASTALLAMAIAALTLRHRRSH